MLSAAAVDGFASLTPLRSRFGGAQGESLATAEVLFRARTKNKAARRRSSTEPEVSATLCGPSPAGYLKLVFSALGWEAAVETIPS